MAGSPSIKVYNAQGEYVASTKHYEEAAMLASCMGDGTTIRCDHSKKWTVWTEGAERISAGESYDVAAEVMAARQWRLSRAAQVATYSAEQLSQFDARFPPRAPLSDAAILAKIGCD